MALTGHLSDLSLSELIEFFCNQRKTGQLKVLYPQGEGYFYLQSGSVMDARIGVLRGIDAVYYSLTLPGAKFEFGAAPEPIERTINQPWTQVVLEGLRRLDEGVVPSPAFPAYAEANSENNEPGPASEETFSDLENLRVPPFLSFISKESIARRRYLVAGTVAVVVLLSVAAIGVPAGWYGRREPSAVITQPSSPAVDIAPSSPVVTEAPTVETVEPSESLTVLAVKRQRDKEKAAAREERIAAQNQAIDTTPVEPATPTQSQPKPVMQPEKPGAKKVTVIVTYDESGRVTQASGGDASAVRIARQKRFPAGKAGSATITIPIN
jgi:Domain of unknown function (DUF4388)